MSAQPGTRKQDGRRLRSQVSRRRIIEAMRDLVEEGNFAPRAEEVAARAEVGLRSVFRHFDDMESLYRELGEIVFAELAPILDVEELHGSAEEVIMEMINRRVRLYERIMPFRTAADVHIHRSPYLQQDRQKVNDTLRKLMRDGLPASIRKDRVLLDALDGVLSFEFWRRLRMDQKLSIPQARRVMEMASFALIKAEGQE